MTHGFPANTTVYVGDTAEFECRFLSDLHPSMKWLRYPINASWTDDMEIVTVS